MHFQPVEPSTEAACLSHAAAAEAEAAPATAADPASLDDVFASEPEASRGDVSHPSDMHRLQSEHATAGYREGITVAKESTIQAGFDEGFSLGATLGLRAGRILGTLEAIAEAVRPRADEAAAAAKALLADARTELSTGRIFDPAYWAPDGNWTFEVEPATGDEILFPDVARAHPLLAKWSNHVDDQIRLWKIDEAILDTETVPRLDPLADEAPVTHAPSTVNRPLDW
ncbi:hypothetical protein CDD83_6505 [Cordyceps sp. RAO-2017]|nr:hypothetical protein CDD83_6505 [Cordyceps sp. RAO-2017]